MPATCPYCGSTLNFGLKFCVVCGRHTTSTEMTKLGGGLKSGIKQADMTKRLDDSLSSADFERTRRPTRLRRHIRSLSEHLFYIFIGCALFFCAVRFTLQTFFPNKVHNILAPILGKNSAVVEQTLTGKAPDKPADSDDNSKSDDKDKKEETASSAPAATNQSKKKSGKKHGRKKRHAEDS